MARELLTGLGPREDLQFLAWSPLGSLAAVTMQAETSVCRLYVMSGASLASMTLQGPQGTFSRAWWPIVWSPAGDRLLLNRDIRPALVTTACASVLRMELVCHGRAVFSPEGRYVAGVGNKHPDVDYDRLCVKLWSATSGALVFSKTCRNLSPVDLTFNCLGDLLLFPGKYGFQVLQFGCSPSSTACNTQLCQAVPLACSWLDRKFEKQYISESE